MPENRNPADAVGLAALEAEAAALHYVAAGLIPWGFARGKLRQDPLYPLLGRSPALAAAGAASGELR